MTSEELPCVAWSHGDRINAVLAAAGYSFSLLLRWLEALLRALFAMLNIAARQPQSV